MGGGISFSALSTPFRLSRFDNVVIVVFSCLNCIFANDTLFLLLNNESLVTREIILT